MAIHEYDVLAGLRGALVEFFVIEQEGSRLRWKTKHGIGMSVLNDVAVNDNDATEIDGLRLSFIDFMAVEFRIPLVTGALGLEEAVLVHGTFENCSTVRPGAARDIRTQDVANAAQGFRWIDRLSGEDFGVWEPIFIIFRVQANCGPQLAELADANRVVSFVFGSRQGREHQAGQNGNNCHHDQQFDKRERFSRDALQRSGFIHRFAECLVIV